MDGENIVYYDRWEPIFIANRCETLHTDDSVNKKINI